MSAFRKNEGKIRLDLVPISLIKAVGEVLTAGLAKYPDRNWEKGFSYSVPYASLMRHLTAFWDGIDNDEETGLSHLKHAAANIAMLIEFIEKNKGEDDRPSVETATEQMYPDNVDADIDYLSSPILTDYDLVLMCEDHIISKKPVEP